MRPVVVGSGLAGLATALELAEHEDVLLVTAGVLAGDAASRWAQGGIAAALAPGDSPVLHERDTWVAGAQVGDRAVIRRMTAAAPAVVASLAELGVAFDRDASGAYDLALEGGHSRHRIAHAGDASGAAITSTLSRLVAGHPRIVVLQQHRADALLTSPTGQIAGLRLAGPSGALVLDATRVVLATGGLGALFPHTTNPLGAVGAGVALAARAGARTDDLHLVQFHPTALDIGVDPAPLLTEALRGAGAQLICDGERFVDELQPRDVVAAAVWGKIQEGRQVLLDASAVPDVARRFPAVTTLLARHGLSLLAPLPVRPAAHYSMGGVTADEQGRTSVPGLWAVGEVSRTGLHGANRLASNSLLEAVVTGRAAAASVLADEPWLTTIAPAEPDLRRGRGPSGLSPAGVRAVVGATCGVLREAESLRAAVQRLDAATGSDEGYVAWLLARSALAHPRSVGAHRRTDERAEVPA